MGPIGPSGQQPAAPPASESIPNIRQPDLQMLLQDNAQLRREAFEERKNGERRIREAEERGRWETERVRKELGEQLKDIEHQNDVLIRSLGRLQGENDRLREENGRLRFVGANPFIPEPRPDKISHPPQASMPARSLSTTVLVPPQDPLTGKTIPLSPDVMKS